MPDISLQHVSYSVSDSTVLDYQELRLPANRKPGWLAIFVAAHGNNKIQVPPEGWSQASEGEATDVRGEMWYRLLDGTEDDIVFWTWNTAAASDALAVLHVFANVDLTTPWYVITVSENLADSLTLALPRAFFLVDGTVMFYAWIGAVSTTVVVNANTEQTENQRELSTIATAIELTSGLPRNLGARDATQAVSEDSVTFAIGFAPSRQAYSDPQEDPKDQYKSIVLREHLMDDAYIKTRDSELAKVLAVLGEADNAIGGLYGKRNFLNPNPLPEYLDIVRRGSSSNTFDGVALGAVGKPVLVVEGDCMIAVNAKRATAGTSSFAAPSGWTLIRQDLQGTLLLAVYAKIATSSEPSSYNWTWAETSSVVALSITAYSGVEPATLLDIDAAMNLSAAQLVFAASSITPVTRHTKLVAAFATDGDYTGPFLNPDMAESVRVMVSGAADLTLLVSDQDWIPTEATLNRAAYLATDNVNKQGIGYMLALRPRLVG